MPTGIAYVDETWNPVCGCTKCSPGCLNCYAEDLHTKRHCAYLAGKKLPRQYAKPFSEIQLFSERLNIPLHWRKPRRILVPSMGDYLHPEVPDDFIYRMFDIARQCPQHKLLFLTKRIERLLKIYQQHPKRDWPISPNIHLGATICTQQEADEILPIALQIPGFDWISIEPMLEEIDLKLSEIQCGNCGFNGDACYECETAYHKSRPTGISRIVVGCESGPKRRPCDLKHIRSIVEQCAATGVGCFVKQIEINGKVSHNPDEWPEWAQVRELI